MIAPRSKQREPLLIICVRLTGCLASNEKRTTQARRIWELSQVIAASGATLALAQGIAEWLRRTRGTKLKITVGHIKAEVENITPDVAERIVEDVIMKK
jgi:hypothetical protein